MKLQSGLSKITDEGAAVLAISIDTQPVARQLRSSLGLTFPILSDPSMEIIRAYRMKGQGMKMANMGYVIIDRMGRIRYRQIDRTFGENVELIVPVLRAVKREIRTSGEQAEKSKVM